MDTSSERNDEIDASKELAGSEFNEVREMKTEKEQIIDEIPEEDVM